MAFSQTPRESTYQLEKVKLIMSNDNRDAAGNTDSIALNGFYDVVNAEVAAQRDYNFVKRDGSGAYPYTIPSTNIRGIFYWQAQDKLLVAYQSSIAICVASTGVLQTTLTPFSSTSGEVDFIEYQYPSGETRIVFTDGTVLGTVNSSNVQVLNSDPDFPSPVLPSLVYLDGYLFVVKQGTSDIYNSALDDPLSWTPSNFISAEMGPDTVTKLARSRNYIVAMGPRSTEFFYNAANATGSPLNRYESFYKEVGYIGGFAQKENTLFFVGQGKETDPTVFTMTDSTITPVANPPLRRFIQPNILFRASVVSNGGKDFYLMNASNITYVLDLDTNLWTRWAFQQNTIFDLKYAVKGTFTGVGSTNIFVLNNSATLYYFDPELYQDAGVTFTSRLQTDRYMFGSMRYKTLSKLVVNADRPNTNANLQVRVSDDDYQTYSSFRTVNLNQEFPALFRWGNFRRRSFDLWFTENAPLRLKSLDVDINMGVR